MNFDRIYDEFSSELSKRGYEFSTSAIKNIIQTSLERKAGLIDLLRKHPNWDEEKMMIHFDEDFSRNRNINEISSFFNSLYALYREYYPAEWYDGPYEKIYTWDSMAYVKSFHDASRRFNPVYEALYEACINMSFVENDEVLSDLARITEYIPEFSVGRGQKMTRVVRKVAELYGWDKFYGFERAYASFADAMDPVKITRHTCISVNPIDFLLQSNGNSWRSCHYIGDYPDDAGGWSSGTISYMLDETSVVFYTVDGGYDGEYPEIEPKIQRQMFAWGDGQLLQSRLYPQSNDSFSQQIYSDIRAIVQKVFADSLGKPNLWIKHDVRNVVAGQGSTFYEDFLHFSSLCSVSELQGDYRTKKQLVVGARPICIQCGSEHSDSDNIVCRDCEGEKYQCERCGCYVDEEDGWWIDDNFYCEDCSFECEWCGRRESIGYSYCVDGDEICEGCFQDKAICCDLCGEYYHIDNTVYIDSEEIDVCVHCVEDNYFRGNCGKWMRKDESCGGCARYPFCDKQPEFDEESEVIFDESIGA